MELNVNQVYAKPSKKLLDHLLETGMVAEKMLMHGRGRHFISVMKKQFKNEITEMEIIHFISFLCAVHDIGKVHPGFQKNMFENSNGNMLDDVSLLLSQGLILEDDDTIRHERYSAEIVNHYLLEKGFNQYFSKIISGIIVYHHQGKQGDVTKPVEKAYPGTERWKAWESLHEEILTELEKHWQISNKMEYVFEKSGFDGFLYLISGIMITSDWIASSPEWERDPQKQNETLSDKAWNFMDHHFLTHTPIRETFSDLKWEDAFSFPKNGLQEMIGKLDPEYSQLLLLEYPCGYGKTEAALLAALKLGGLKGGIYIGAPTTSTAKALTKRMQDLADKIGFHLTIPELDGSMIWSDDDMNKIDDDIWTGRTRHHLLYPYSVGTIDQILKSVIAFRYSGIGMLGLSDKAIIIDEVHAYDAYMLTELETLLKWCRFLAVPVVLLSATLPTKTKEKLFMASGFNQNKLSEIEKGYPMISMIKNGELFQESPDCIPKKMSLSVEITEKPFTFMKNKAMELESGCMALITATVKDAFLLWEELKRNITDCEVVLYQGMDTVSHKSDKIKKLLDLCGKDRSNRPEKLILVATSIIEQSIDVDFDYMITEIAPIDLLIQRMGRVWRHDDKGTVREHKNIENPFTVVIPWRDRKLFGGAVRIYGTQCLEYTKAVLEAKINGEIDLIQDIRGMIDEVYSKLPDNPKSEFHAKENVLSSPYNKNAINVKYDEMQYHKFDEITPITRETKYATKPVAMITKEELIKLEDIKDFSEIRKVMLENVINVPEKKTTLFLQKAAKVNNPYFENIMILPSDDFFIEGDGAIITLTDDGLRIKEDEEINPFIEEELEEDLEL